MRSKTKMVLVAIASLTFATGSAHAAGCNAPAFLQFLCPAQAPIQKAPQRRWETTVAPPIKREVKKKEAPVKEVSAKIRTAPIAPVVVAALAVPPAPPSLQTKRSVLAPPVSSVTTVLALPDGSATLNDEHITKAIGDLRSCSSATKSACEIRVGEIGLTLINGPYIWPSERGSNPEMEAQERIKNVVAREWCIAYGFTFYNGECK